MATLVEHVFCTAVALSWDYLILAVEEALMLKLPNFLRLLNVIQAAEFAGENHPNVLTWGGGKQVVG